MANSSLAVALLLAMALSGSTWAESSLGNGSKISGGGLQQQFYTHQYAKQFSQYMSSGGQGTGGTFPQFASGFLGGHASGFKKYMDRPGSNATTGKSASSGDFQEYMRDYAGHVDYQRYLHQGGAQQPHFGGNQTQGQSYQQYADKYGDYMDQYAGDYVDFMGQMGASNVTAPSVEASATPGGSYQQYVDKYGDYQKYLRQDGAQHVQSGGYQRYIDGYAPNLTNASDNKEWAAHYMRAYAAEYKMFLKENGSNYSADFAQHLAGSNMTQDDAIQRWGKSSMDKYAAPFEHYMHRQAAASIAPASAGSCHTVSELQAWRAAKLEQITSYVPQAYRASAKDAVERTFHSNRARIERERAIQAQRLADKEASKAAQKSSATPADKKAGKVAQQGSAATADETSNGTTAAVDSANRKTDQGSADQATATPPFVATNASTVQLAGEGSAELVRETRVDRSVASIAAVAVLVALLGAYVGKGRRQRAMEPEGYVNLLAEP